jgi:hypothetical protein
MHPASFAADLAGVAEMLHGASYLSNTLLQTLYSIQETAQLGAFVDGLSAIEGEQNAIAGALGLFDLCKGSYCENIF